MRMPIEPRETRPLVYLIYIPGLSLSALELARLVQVERGRMMDLLMVVFKTSRGRPAFQRLMGRVFTTIIFEGQSLRAALRLAMRRPEP